MRIEGAGAEAQAVMTYDYQGGAFPVLWFAPSLAVDFTEMEGCVWVDNGDGSATVTAPAATPAGFWFATSSKKIGATFVSTMPAHFTAGVFGSTNALPVVYDSTIEITSGGNRYRIPAQAMGAN